MSIRPVKRVIEAKPTTEGAGVKLHRAFGFGNTATSAPKTIWPASRGIRTVA